MSAAGAACRVCGEPAAMLLPDCPDYVTGDRFAVRRCERCRLAFTAPQPAVMDKYYASSYRQYGPATLAALHWLYRRRARQWHRSFDRPGRALELGCGDATMLRTLRDAGWRVVGLERTADVAAHASTRLGQPVLVGDLDSIDPSDRFDLIVLFQVLEHMGDPLSVLRRCAALLTPHGQLVIGVPNIASWQAGYAGNMWFHLDVPRHPFHFSPESLTTLCRRAGMEVVEVSYVSPEHDPFGWVQSVLNKVSGRQNALTQTLMGVGGGGLGKIAMLAGAAVLAPIGVALALCSWVGKRGAIMHVTSRLAADRPAS